MKDKTTWKDDALITAIQTGGAAREEALRQLYLRPGLRETVIRHVLDHGGAFDDARDVFQDTLVLFDRNLREGRYEGRSALSTYFVAIAKWHWLTLRRQKGRYGNLEEHHYEGTVESPEADALRGEERTLLAEALTQIGERCKGLLRLYQLDYSMEEIANTMGYSGADVAKKEAYRCRMKLREILEKNPYWKR